MAWTGSGGRGPYDFIKPGDNYTAWDPTELIFTHNRTGKNSGSQTAWNRALISQTVKGTPIHRLQTWASGIDLSKYASSDKVKQFADDIFKEAALLEKSLGTKVSQKDYDKLTGGLTKSLGTKVSQRDYDKLTGQIGTRLTDLENKGVSFGDVQGLREQLDSILGEQATGDEQLQDLINQYGQASTQSIGDLRSDLEGNYLTTSDFETRMGSGLQNLQDVMRDEWGSDIESLDIGAVRDAINLQRGDFSSLSTQFAGLQDVVGEQGIQQAQGLEAASGHRELIDQELQGLTGKDIELSGGIESLKDKLGDYKTDVAGQFGDVQRDYEKLFGEEAQARQAALSQEAQARTSGLNALAQSGQQAISDVYKTREQAIGDLESTWGENLQAQEESMSNKLAEGKAEMNKRLSDIASTMDYRMLGNSALGIRHRRSKAFKSGEVSTGTGQLSRGSSRINTLNIA